MSEKVDLSIIIPCFKEEERLKINIDKVFAYLNDKPFTYEVIIVDANSPDKTKMVVEEKQKKYKNLKFWQASKREGKGHDVKYAMLNLAVGENSLFFDADLATPITYIENFMNLRDDGYDVIIGSRYLNNKDIEIKQSILRRVISRAGNLAIQILILPGLKDTQCGFKLFSKSAAKDLFSRQTINGWGFDMEILVIARKMGYKIKEVPVHWKNEESHAMIGKDNLSNPKKVAMQTLKDLLTVKKNLFLKKYSIRKISNNKDVS